MFEELHKMALDNGNIIQDETKNVVKKDGSLPTEPYTNLRKLLNEEAEAEAKAAKEAAAEAEAREKAEIVLSSVEDIFSCVAKMVKNTLNSKGQKAAPRKYTYTEDLENPNNIFAKMREALDEMEGKANKPSEEPEAPPEPENGGGDENE